MHIQPAASDSDSISDAPPVGSEPLPSGRSAAAFTVAVLAIVNFLNYVDRMLVPPLFESLKRDLSMSNTQAGLLSSAFTLVHAVATIPLGILADRYMRKWIILAGVSLWSLATAAGGLASSFGQLFFSRALVGIGEAAYAPAATALIGEAYPRGGRNLAIGIFQVGTFVGAGAGLYLGGKIGHDYGWRYAFFICGLPGLIFALLTALIREQPRRRLPAATAAPSSFDSLVARPMIGILADRVLWLTVLGGILITFTTGGLNNWGPSFVMERLGYTQEQAANFLAPSSLVAGILGVLSGSAVAWVLARRTAGAKLYACAIGFALGMPFNVLVIFARQETLFLVSVALAVYFYTWYLGPILAAILDQVEPGRQATVVAIYFVLIHLFGDLISPPLMGWMADVASLTAAMWFPVAAAALAVAALVLAGNARHAARPTPVHQTS